MTNDAKPMQITIYHSWENGNAKNCRYPNMGTGSTEGELKALFCYDHTFSDSKITTVALITL